MAIQFTKATKKKARARVALIGPSGSGKTWTSLIFASRLAELAGGRVAFIDTERGSASKYSDSFDFDVVELEEFAPATYVAAIKAADDAGYAAIVIDSLSHAWIGKGGALEMKDRAATASRSGNSFDAWRTVTPEHNKLVDAILASRAHVFATMRTKTEYVIEENERGKKAPRKVGLAPVQRDGLEYEFDVVADMDPENNMIVSKTRCSAFAGGVYKRPGIDVADILARWLDDGADAPPRPAPSAPAEPEDFFASIASASDMNDLQAVARRISKANCGKDLTSQLRTAWEERKKAITQASSGEAAAQ